MKKVLFFCALFLLFNLKSFSQNSDSYLPNYSPPSPEASALGKYVEHPVGYYTGTPNISIPLFEIKCGRITVPISLSYHGSGVKVDEIASRVGTGWVLNAGGLVTRTIKGTWTDETSYGTSANGFFSSQVATDLSNGVWIGSSSVDDLEPDEHFYNFGSKSGKIYFKDKTHGYSSKIDPIKIDGPYNGSNRFIITAEDGLIYTFSDTENSWVVHTSSNGGGNINSNYTSSWYLTRIDDPTTGKNVQFFYRTDMGSAINYTQQNSLQDNLFCGTHIGGSASVGIMGNTLLNVKILERIVYDEGYIELKADHNRLDLTGDKAYTEINQYTNNGVSSDFIKGFSLSYAYTSNGSGQDNYRLYLESIQQKGINAGLLPPYQFFYKNRDQLPMRNSIHQDIWGYYNANTGTEVDQSQGYSQGYSKVYVQNNNGRKTYLPFPNNNSSPSQIIDGVERSCNPATVDYGSLIKVTYPTKGYTTYSYEVNQFDITDYTGGGIRVKEIDDFSLTDQLLLSKKYYYNNGKLGGAYPQVAFPQPNSPIGTRLLRFTKNQTALGSCNGSYVGYGNVVEVQSTATGNNGQTQYWYSQDQDTEGSFLNLNGGACLSSADIANIQAVSNFPFFEMESSDNKRGILQKKIVLDKYGKPLSGTEYHYTPISHPIMSIYSSRAIGWDDHDGTTNSWITGVRQINADKMLLTSSTDFIYTGTDIQAPQPSLQNTTNYTYTSGNYDGAFIRSKSVEMSAGQNLAADYLTTQYTYPFDYSNAGSTSGYPNVLSAMTDMNYVSPVIEQSTYKGVSSTFLQSSKTDYSYWDNTGPVSYTTSQIHPVLFSTKKAAGNYEPRVQYNNYNTLGNVLNVSKAGGEKINYIYSYSGTLPIAVISNADYSAIVTALGGQSIIDSFRDLVSPTDADINMFIAPLRNLTNFPNAQVTSYTYKPLVGVASMTDVKGLTKYYEYDNFQRLSTVRDNMHNIVKSYCYNYKGQQTNCSVPQVPQTVYARIEITNQTYSNWQNGPDYYYTASYGDVYLRFYSDASCQTALTLPSGMTVSVATTTNFASTYNGYSTYASTTDYSVSPGVSSVYLGNLTLYFDMDDWGDDYSYSYYDYGYDTVGHTGSNYVCEGYIYY